MGFLLLASDGWLCAGLIWVWQIILFTNMGRSFAAYGGAIAIGALASALAGLFLGRFVDAGHGRRAALIAFSVLAITILVRASATSPAVSVFASTLGALVVCLYTPTMMTAIYNMSKASPCTLRYHMVSEGGYDLGASLGCLASAGLIWVGVPLWQTMLLALIGAVSVMLLQRRYYGTLVSA